MSLTGSDAVLHIMSRLTQVRQVIYSGKYFADPEQVETIFKDANTILQSFAKRLILEECKEKE